MSDSQEIIDTPGYQRGIQTQINTSQESLSMLSGQHTQTMDHTEGVMQQQSPECLEGEDLSPPIVVAQDSTLHDGQAHINRTQGVQAVRWFGTYNHPTTEMEFNEEEMSYLGRGFETGDNGNEHLQFVVHWKKRKRITEIKKLGDPWDIVHLEVQRGTNDEARIYCSKEGGLFLEDGRMVTSGATRCYNDMIAALEEGTPLRGIMKDHLGNFIRHARAVTDYLQFRAQEETLKNIVLPPIVLQKWQAELLDYLEEEPHPRQMLWYVDQVGGMGKSTFSRQLAITHNALYLTSTATDRVLRCYNNQRVVIMDITRDIGLQDAINYSCIETLKSGIGFSSMYEPRQMLWNTPHVIVFSNFFPNYSRLSQDRFNIITLSIAPPPAMIRNGCEQPPRSIILDGKLYD